MYKVKKWSVWLLLCVSIMNLTACSKPSMMKEPTPYYSFSIDGEKIFYDKDEAFVKDNVELANTALNAIFNQDYTSFNPDDQLNLYSEAKRNRKIELGAREELTETVNKNKLKIEVKDIQINSMTFFKEYDEQKTCISASITRIAREGNDEYLKSVGLTKNEEITSDLNIDLILDEDEWKLDTYDLSGH